MVSTSYFSDLLVIIVNILMRSNSEKRFDYRTAFLPNEILYYNYEMVPTLLSVITRSDAFSDESLDVKAPDLAYQASVTSYYLTSQPSEMSTEW